jgi:hypothetical protein
MVRHGPPCKLVGREPVEARVRPLAVGVVPPASQHLAGMRQAAEHRLVQQLGIMEQAHQTGFCR